MSNIFKKKSIPNTLRQDAKIAFFLGLSVFLMLVIFQPFGTYNFQNSSKNLILGGYGLVIGVGYFVFSRGLPLIFNQFFDRTQWTFGKEMLTSLVVFLLIVAATYFYRNFVLDFNFWWYDFLIYIGMAFSVGIFPISIIFLVRYMKIKNAPVVIYQPSPAPNVPTYVTIEGENKNEKIKFAKAELLFIKASDNYVVVHLGKEGKVTKHMLRSSLSKVARQLEDQDIFQVHRSYVVNLDNVTELGGKSPNYHLQLKSYQDIIPVSRTKVNTIRAKLQEKPV